MTLAFELDVLCREEGWLQAWPEPQARAEAIAATLFKELLPELKASVEISLVLADDAFVQELNRQYRQKDKPTNVLSFASLDDPLQELRGQGEGQPLSLGDVVMALQTVRREAEEQGKSFDQHASHLLVHGILHLLGYDHEDEGEALEMESRETEILAKMAIPDPYAEPAAGHR